MVSRAGPPPMAIGEGRLRLRVRSHAGLITLLPQHRLPIVGVALFRAEDILQKAAGDRVIPPRGELDVAAVHVDGAVLAVEIVLHHLLQVTADLDRSYGGPPHAPPQGDA